MIQKSASYDINKEILDELKKISKLMALQALKNESHSKKVALLDEVGFEPIEIALLIGDTPGRVRRLLSEIYNKRKDG